MTGRLSLPWKTYENGGARLAFTERLLEALAPPTRRSPTAGHRDQRPAQRQQRQERRDGEGARATTGRGAAWHLLVRGERGLLRAMGFALREGRFLVAGRRAARRARVRGRRGLRAPQLPRRPRARTAPVHGRHGRTGRRGLHRRRRRGPGQAGGADRRRRAGRGVLPVPIPGRRRSVRGRPDAPGAPTSLAGTLCSGSCVRWTARCR